MLPTIKESACACSCKERDDSLILDGEMSDTEIDTEMAEVEKFVDNMNKHIDYTKTLDRRLNELDNEIKILRIQVFELQAKLDNELKYNYYIGSVFSASFAVTLIFLRRIRL